MRGHEIRHEWSAYVAGIALPFVLVLLFAAPASGDHDDVDDLVLVHLLDRTLVAIRGEGVVTQADLQLDESVSWHGFRGNVGAVVTNRRVLAITSGSSAWQESPLRLSEATSAVPLVSRHLVAVNTGQRILIFDALIGTFFEWRYPLNESVVAFEAHGDVVAAVLGHQVMAYGAGGARPVSTRLHLREKFAGLDLQTKTATVTTSKRLLSFRTESTRWAEIDRKIQR